MKWYIQPHGNMYRETIWEVNMDYMPVGHRYQSSVLLAVLTMKEMGGFLFLRLYISMVPLFL